MCRTPETISQPLRVPFEITSPFPASRPCSTSPHSRIHFAGLSEYRLAAESAQSSFKFDQGGVEAEEVLIPDALGLVFLEDFLLGQFVERIQVYVVGPACVAWPD